MAQRWEQKVKSIDSTYTLFLKHYGQSWMPPSYRGTILFVDDSQEFTSGLTQMVSEFKSWGAKFSPNKVVFQFGYPKDSTWWKLYADPPKTIGDALLANVPNTYGLFWVDFTVVRVFPVLQVREASLVLPDEFLLEQNYPNPFNPITDLRFTIADFPPEADAPLAQRFVTLTIYDVLGRERSALVSERLKPGSYAVRWDAGDFPSGVYLCRLQVDNMAKVIKLVLVK
jgi:hypothetical protein